MLNTELKVFAKVLPNRWQAVMDRLVKPKQTCAVRGRTIQDNLHLMRTVVDRVNTEAALINLDQSKASDRVNHGFLGAVFLAAGFGPVFRKGILILYDSSCAMVEVNGTWSSTFRLSRSIHQGCPLSPLLRKLKANLVLRGITLPGANENAGYSAYANDVTVLVASKE